ncbi:glycosyl hydrolases family 18 domain-containing protein [Phthorimaea operculella]|nr:glycosyl hydrolases family 18 domain-containing protein [Phthorimaea operculella]
MNTVLFLTATLAVGLAGGALLDGPLYTKAGNRIICYYGTWATDREGDGRFRVEDVDTSLCTHLVYAFVGINAEGFVISLDPELDLPDNNGRDNFGKFNALKEKNPKLKTILSVGGWGEGSANYSIMAASEATRKNFISSALELVETHGFDGFDIDWEYPARRDSVNGEKDIDNFTQLLKELKAVFSPKGYEISAAVSAVESAAVQSYDVPAICEILDLVFIMTYDLYGPWANFTDHNAPLFKGENNEENTVESAINFWLKDCPSNKVIIGLPLYGKSYILADAKQSGVGAPATGAGLAGPFSGEAGTLGYGELCPLLQNKTANWEVRRDNLAKVPYAVQGNNWVSYDDAQSLTDKINWGLGKKLGGVMLWSLENDDFNGKCGQKFPLLNAINKAVKSFASVTLD